MCPANRIGKVDLYLVSHHGIDRSNSPALVHAAAAHSPAYWLKVSAERDGTFTVTNPRNGFSKTYRPLD
jgi:hypothetical protein